MNEIEKYTGTHDLPRFVEDSWEGHISAWTETERAEVVVQLYRGAIASSVETRYGENSMEEFAFSVGVPAKTLWEYRRIYRRLESLEESDRSEILGYVEDGPLSYSHLIRANAIEDDAEYKEILTEAHDGGWSQKRLAEERSHRTSPKVANAPTREESDAGEVVDEKDTVETVEIVEVSEDGEVVRHYVLSHDGTDEEGDDRFKVETRTGRFVAMVSDYDPDRMRAFLDDANRGYSNG